MNIWEESEGEVGKEWCEKEGEKEGGGNRERDEMGKKGEIYRPT